MGGGVMEFETQLYMQGEAIPEIKKETHYGVKFMCLTIIMLIISIILSLATTILFDPESYSMIFGRIEWGIMILLTLLSFLFWFIFIVLIFITFFLFHRGRFEFGEKHRKNFKIAFICIACYFILFLISIFLPLSLYFAPLSSINYFNGLWQAFYILETFFLGFALLFLIKGFTNKKALDIVFLFSMLFLAIAIIDSAIENIYFNPQLYTEQLFRTYRSYTIILQSTRIAVWLIALYGFYLTLSNFDLYSRFVPDDKQPFLPRPKPIAKYVYNFYSKPMTAFIVMLLIAAVIGSWTSMAVDIDVNPNDLQDSVSYEEQQLGDVKIYSISRTGQIQEYTEKSMSLDLEEETYCATITLIWIDEADNRFSTNEPDTFTLTVDCGLDIASKTDSNPYGQMGMLDLYFDSSEDELFIDYLDITISLDQAGDVSGPIGFGLSPLNEEDTSNDYTLKIECKCIEYDVE
jgi:hypothetical protein